MLTINFVFAQIDTSDIDNLRKSDQSKYTKDMQNRLMSPNGQSSLSNFTSNLSLVSSFSEGKNAKIELKYLTQKRLNIGFNVDQKIGDNAKTAVPFELNGMSPGTTISLDIGKILWNNVELSKQYRDLFQKAKEKYCKKYPITDCRTVTLSEIVDSLGKDEINIKLKKPTILNFKVALTKTEFNYTTDSISLKEFNNSYFSPAISVSLIKPLGNLELVGYIALTYNYSQNYNEGDNLSLLTPFGTTHNYINKSIIFGEPFKKIDHKLNIEYRRNFLNEFAVSPSLTYGFNSKNLSISMPIYFINGTDKDGKSAGLQAGIKFSYITNTKNGSFKSFEDGLNIQLLVAAPFDAFAQMKKK